MARLATTLVVVCSVGIGGGTAAADTPTPTTTPTSTAVPEPTARPSPSPTAVPTATGTGHLRLTPSPEAAATPEPKKRRSKGKPRTETPTPAAPPAADHGRRRHQSKRHKHKVKPKPTATATSIPPISLTTEDSVRPVSCNGPPKPAVSTPFLSQPYAGWTSIVSYFDHDAPNFTRDGLLVTASGLEARPDAVHQAPDFPAYWSAQLRQYVYYDGHNGYDFKLWYKPVYAAAAGKVIFAGYEYPDAPDHGYGAMVMIEHRHGYVTLYGHFSKLRVKAGQHVKRLQEIGISGNTGHSSGPHLHFTLFHKCTPVDPYGWGGSGPDPLAGYQNESSTYLWLRPPLVSNPPPEMPGLRELPPTSSQRLLLLRLPSTSRGTGAFFQGLRTEMQRTRAALGKHVRGVKADVLQAALDITAPVTASRLYSLPNVASIASSDAAPDAGADVLAAVARAALVTAHRRVAIGRSGGWSGFLLQWEGRTFLVGKGPKAKEVRLQLAHGRGGATVHTLRTDPSSGAYAVDLGRLSKRQVVVLNHELQGGNRHAALSVQPVRASAPPADSHQAGGPDMTSLVAIGLVLLAFAAALGVRRGGRTHG